MQIERLTPARFAAHRDALANLLIDAVEGGASVGFVLPINRETALAWVDGLAASVADGSRIIWLAFKAGQAIGTVQLELATKQNGRNRAEVQKLLVLRSARRLGVARALMAALEESAPPLQRGLLYLDTEAGSPAEDFYRSLGWQYAGGLPDYACSPDGVWAANAIYYKTLFRRNPA
ncbi:GNAT family N-acetyltransferase [Niveibacterium sp. 24ML]|uniref:GNAT family N-acetyltransferase n=1 Tax=Niveibacterium sp. 24ML TaxID=2985512 RepID=UPI00226F25B1|nr:GNAT family N-acetyltransferase [Niveibacterium sp. 24ML]MCX9157475.1 GNAT family N-acetyltransferase [Niveibacterium sp. 24ML]